MADSLLPGVWWLHGTRGSNVYLVEADDGSLALVDTGFASSAEAILREVQDLGGTLSAILLTHRHRDHSGAAGELLERTGATVVLGRGDCIERDGEVFMRVSVGRSHVGPYVFSKARGRRSQDVPVGRPIEEEGEVLPGIRAVPVPGHTPGSCCFVVDRLGAAFVGDLVISHDGHLTRSMQMANTNDAQYLESLRRFGEVAPEAGFPGHGKPVLEGFGDALRELAAMPRATTPGNLLRRPVRLWRFSRQMIRTRPPR